MPEWQLNTPVAFIVFNRPETTERVFAEIARAKPPKLLVIADGPRKGRADEADRCKRTRAIVDRVDWDCEVISNFSDTNLGCRKRVSSGVDWIFEQVPEAIILEDDCLPHPTFFRYCEELLKRYRDDERVAQIGGGNFQFGRKRTEASYYFSRYHHIWGWASWRRAWKHYDVTARIWPEFLRDDRLDGIAQSISEKQYWRKVFQAVFDEKIDTWDYQWVLSSWSQGMLAIIPEVNLISNIGFGVDATHTKGRSIYSALPTEAMSFPMVHPSIVLPHRAADRYTGSNHFTRSIPRRLLVKLKAMF